MARMAGMLLSAAGLLAIGMAGAPGEGASQAKVALVELYTSEG